MSLFCFVRKIEIVKFASRTRQLFVRLLALVKWMNSASKVSKCGVSAVRGDFSPAPFTSIPPAHVHSLIHHHPSSYQLLSMPTYPRWWDCQSFVQNSRGQLSVPACWFSASMQFCPINCSSISFLCGLDRQIAEVSGETRDGSFLFFVDEVARHSRWFYSIL